jgi:hypothetical protein
VCGAHDQANHEQVASRVRNTIRVVSLVEGDGHLGLPEQHQCGDGMDGIHLLLDDAVLPVRLVRLVAPEDHDRQRSAMGNSASSSGVASASSSALGASVGIF